MSYNDNDPTLPGATPDLSDASGQAALILVESLLHGLCEKRTLNTPEAIAIVDRAISVQFDHAEAADGKGAAMWRSHTLLSSIAASLRTDGDAASLPPQPLPRLAT